MRWIRKIQPHRMQIAEVSKPLLMSLYRMPSSLLKKDWLHQHACSADLPYNLDTPHSNEPLRPFMCTVAPMGQLQHLTDYTCHRMSHTYPHPNLSAHGHLFHPGTQQGSPAHLHLLTHPSCRYQGVCAMPKTVRATWEPRVSCPQAYNNISAVLGEVRRHRTLYFHQ